MLAKRRTPLAGHARCNVWGWQSIAAGELSGFSSEFSAIVPAGHRRNLHRAGGVWVPATHPPGLPGPPGGHPWSRGFAAFE